MNKYENFSRNEKPDELGKRYKFQRKKSRMCLMKRQYKTKEEAEEDKGARVYKCPHCGNFHRASKVKRRHKADYSPEKH